MHIDLKEWHIKCYEIVCSLNQITVTSKQPTVQQFDV
jgi:hypothetical protein